jgi:hypothetical protein
LLVELDAEVVQRNPGRQTSPQTLKLVGSFSAKAKGIVELLVNRLHDLAAARHPTPQPLGPSPFAPLSSGRADDTCSVVLEPPSVVLFAFEALIGDVGSRGRRSYARRPGVRLAAQGEEGLKANGWSLVEAPAKPKPVITPVGLTATSKRKPSYHPIICWTNRCRPVRPAIPRLFSWRPGWASPRYPALRRDTSEPPSSAPGARPPPR